MDSLYGFEAGKTAETSAPTRTRFPTTDEIDILLNRARKLRAEAAAAGLSTLFRALTRPLLPIGAALGRWQERRRTREALMRRSDRLLADIGAERANIDAFLRGKTTEDDPAHQPSALWRTLIGRIETGRRELRQRKRIESELMAYADSELDDINIRRVDIPRIARGLHPVPG